MCVSQRETCRCRSLLLLCSSGDQSGSQAWQEVPFPIAPSPPGPIGATVSDCQDPVFLSHNSVSWLHFPRGQAWKGAGKMAQHLRALLLLQVPGSGSQLTATFNSSSRMSEAHVCFYGHQAYIHVVHESKSSYKRERELTFVRNQARQGIAASLGFDAST